MRPQQRVFVAAGEPVGDGRLRHRRRHPAGAQIAQHPAAPVARHLAGIQRETFGNPGVVQIVVFVQGCDGGVERRRRRRARTQRTPQFSFHPAAAGEKLHCARIQPIGIKTRSRHLPSVQSPPVQDILVIGGVAAGLSAASRARRLAPDARITVLERGPEAGYSACGLPYFLAGRIQRLEALRAHPPEFFREQRQLQLLTGHRALEIEPGRHRVRALGPQGELWLSYDRLIIATGARQRWQPPATLRNVFSANTWEQALELDTALRAGGLRRIAVVGGGYIGLETATALAQRGLQVALVHAHAHLLRGFEPELTAKLPDSLAAAGIELHLATRVSGLGGAHGGRILGLETSQGTIACDALVNCGGLQPEVALAEAAGCVLGSGGAVAVDERQQTSFSAILAAGDCAATRHRVSGAPVWVPLGAAANKQGRVAGENAVGRGTGRPARFPGVLATLAVPLAGQEYGRTGLSLEQARSAGFDVAAVTVQGASRAGYMQPDAITCRLVYQPSTGRALGVHFLGAPGTVAGRLDTAAAVLTAGLHLDEIEMLDCAYSPALAPLYEPLLIAAHNARRA